MNVVRRYLSRAQEALRAARILLDAGMPRDAASRGYYAFFYAASAALASRGLEYSKHSAVIAAFGRELVKTGLVDARYHAALREPFDIRNVADYRLSVEVPPDQARQLLAKAEEFVEAMRALVGCSSGNGKPDP